MDPSRSSPPPAAGGGDAQDVAWMRRVRQGDREAFAALVACHRLRVVGTVARLLGGDAGDAEDIGQQVFLRVWQSAGRYEATAKFTTWLYTITRNLAFNELRRRKLRPTSSLEAWRAGGEPAPPLREAGAEPPDASLLAGELQEAIAGAIATLPETQRLAIVLRRHEELSYEEIGAVLKLTEPAVKSLLFRARTGLRERLSRYLEA